MRITYISDLDFTGKEGLYSVIDQYGYHVVTFDNYGEAEEFIENEAVSGYYKIYSWGVMGSYV